MKVEINIVFISGNRVKIKGKEYFKFKVKENCIIIKVLGGICKFLEVKRV